MTAGAYDENRWAKGERPGAFKLEDYRIAEGMDYAPEDVAVAIDDLLEEVATAMDAPNANHLALTPFKQFLQAQSLKTWPSLVEPAVDGEVVL